MTPEVKDYLRRCLAAQHLSWEAHCAEVEALAWVFDTLPESDQAAILSGDLVIEFAEVWAREQRYRLLTRPGPLSGPNPFYKFWALRRRIRPLFANTWGSA